MGMYTGLSFIGYVKPHMAQDLKTVLSNYSWEMASNPKLQAIKNKRIPWGAVEYMPSSWNKYKGVHFYNGILTFTCSLKNYNNDIHIFMTTIPKVLCDRYYAIELYEENAEDDVIYYENDLKDNEAVICHETMTIEDLHENIDIINKIEILGL